MSYPLVSIIVPVYKVEAYLERCLDSIVAQDYYPIEVILINDGSPDRCDLIISRYEALWPYIRSYHQENKGLSAARNAGIEHARGIYLTFIDSDDYIEPDYISCLVDVAMRLAADVVVCSFFVHLPGRKAFIFPLLTGHRKMTGEAAARKSLRLYSMPTFAWNKLYRRSLFLDRNIRFPSIYYEDIATMSRLLVHAECVVITRKPLYHYCIRKTGITGDFRQKNIEDYLEAVRIIRQFICDRGYGKEWGSTFRFFLLAVESQLLLEIMLKMKSMSLYERKHVVLHMHQQIRQLSVLQQV